MKESACLRDDGIWVQRPFVKGHANTQKGGLFSLCASRPLLQNELLLAEQNRKLVGDKRRVVFQCNIWERW